jgi:hypothetical protein
MADHVKESMSCVKADSISKGIWCTCVADFKIVVIKHTE